LLFQIIIEFMHNRLFCISRDRLPTVFLRSPLLIFLLIFSLGSYAELNAQSTPAVLIKVMAGSEERLNTPVSTSLKNVPQQLADYHLQLVETTDGKETPVASQLEPGYNPQLHWVLNGSTPAGSSRTFELKFISPNTSSPKVMANDSGEGITLKVNDQEVMTYHYGLTPVPDGVAERYRRGGYIHPLKAPNGGTLTRIQPPDHYHHYGVWNPWTKTEFEGKELDFWNLYKGQGTVRVKDVPVVTEGDVYGQVTAIHEHVVVDTLNPANDKVALNEVWNLRAWNLSSGDTDTENFLVDFSSTLNPATDQPFTIKEYRYQGFGFRANEHWNDESASLVTSQGYNKADGNGTRARWCYVHGPTEAGTAGVLFMTSPTNFNYPEQIRIWPTGMNEGQENVFFNFNPAMDRDWTLEPGNQYILNYRMITYSGEMDSVTAERHWYEFAHPPEVEVAVWPSLAGKKVLVYTKNGEGYVHENIPASVDALKKLGEENGFEVVSSEDPALFTEDNLAQFDALVFSNTNNEAFDTDAQKQAFQHYIRSGGGFVGIHSASGSERQWDWFAQMLGGRFHRHPPRQDFEVKVLDKNHPSTHFLPDIWHIVDDECYYLKNLNPANHVLLAADLTTVEDEKREEYPANYFGDLFPLSWCHEFDGGRQWYTALGHRSEHYSDPQLMQHILGGIRWAIGPN